MKRILITGVSRPSGIGATLAGRFAEEGYEVLVHGSSQYDQDLRYKDAGQEATLSDDIVRLKDSDLSVEGNVEKLFEEAGKIDRLVLNHAYSTMNELGDWTYEEINRHLITNVTASMLFIQAYSKQSSGGCITLFTSGQSKGSISGEIPYAVSKEAISEIGRQSALVLGEKNIRVNVVNPGPTDTGNMDKESDIYQDIADRFNQKRWGTPDDIANLVLFLHSDKGSWITGEVISSEGGFNRFN
ncbi:SDR family oxidoreductase [Macrococcus brunensis]|uniref:SDR family oxidoreductase n=1 Tax=Macrococcus brunensis TaxID=198483 RepID=UPI001EEFB9FA|nr:SDR family oxidoreductase [Macrococcus brunensis]ULG72319.1 SDR family oxidoreductase [Macrococcus brunensis]